MNPKDEDMLTTKKELTDFTRLSHQIAREKSRKRVRKYSNDEVLEFLKSQQMADIVKALAE